KIKENNTTWFAGGIYAQSTIVNISRSEISTNEVGGLFGSGASEWFIDKTSIVNNESNGLTIADYSSFTITNSVLFGNQAQALFGLNETLTISYSLVENGQDSVDINDGILNWGDGNIDVDPMFVDTANNDFTLQYTSPCIDAGDPDLDGDGEDYTTDTDDQDPDGTRADMGAYFFDQTNVNIVYITPDSLDFTTDLDTLSMTIGYVGLGDFSWNITDAPDWLTFNPSESGRGENYQDVGPPKRE
ncbi:MAG: right-handed parallel beta-helix repeat-containing protein, partial [Arenicellales bacterium]|nr:right-handed parallel beta-helix repeat-containing protein [Arenicellales bacterium]